VKKLLSGAMTLVLVMALLSCGGHPTEPLTIATTDLNEGTATHAYSFTLKAIGGTPPYHWTVVGGELPPGLSLSDDGRISGTVPDINEKTEWTFTVRVTDSH
jgi:hypothetical protein